MEMKHLSDQQWAELLMPHDGGTEHLSQCPSCREEHDKLHNLLSTLPGCARSAAEQPEIFWDRQRLAIQSRIAKLPSSRQRSTRLAWAATLALILIASLILRTGSHVPVQHANADPDRELLVQVEEALDGEVPQALQPASLLANEMNQAARPHSNSPKSKENTQHED